MLEIPLMKRAQETEMSGCGIEKVLKPGRVDIDDNIFLGISLYEWGVFIH